MKKLLLELISLRKRGILIEESRNEIIRREIKNRLTLADKKV